jgi:hypothetical protein
MNPNYGYTSAPGSQQRQLDYLEDWLIALVQQTKRTNELLEAQARPGSKTETREEWRIEKLGKRIESALANQLSSRLNQAQGLANRGFSGTVEQARMDYAMEQLGRQFAAVMKPVMDALTYGAVQIEMRMRRMSGSEQNGLLGLGVGAFAGRMIGGTSGMLAGGLIGSALTGRGGDSNSALMGALVGGWAGFKASGGNPFATLGAAAIGGVSSSGDYGRFRASGSSRLGAALGALGSNIADVAEILPGMPEGRVEDWRRRSDRLYRGAGGGEAPRRDVTPFSSEMMDAGGTYFAIQRSMIRATAGPGFEEDSPLKPIIDGMITIIEWLMKIAGVDAGTAPMSATTARGAEGGLAGALAPATRPRS